MSLSRGQAFGQDSLAGRLSSVREGIDDAARSADRSPDELTTIVITKFHPASLVEELYALGVRDVGENRHQEAMSKADELSALDGLRWHFVGQLQSNKARQARRYASAVHSVDRIGLVDALERAEDAGGVSPLPCFVQINLTGDAARGGVQPAELEGLVERVLDAPSLSLLGAMAVAPLGEEPAAAFARLRSYSDRIRSLAPNAVSISAGMSHDYAAAIKEGATHLRIGTAITGNRPTPG